MLEVPMGSGLRAPSDLYRQLHLHPV